MATKPSNDLVMANNARVAAKLRELAEQVQSGEIRGYEFKQTDSTVSLTVDSADGNQRIIRQKTFLPGLTRNNTEQIKKQPAVERRKLVKYLAQEGMTQTEIAKRTMYSQKTISNDINKLKANGEL